MKIIINCTAAREGGAKTIIKSYLESIKKDNSEYVAIGPNWISELDLSNNVKHIVKETSGIQTFLFSTIFVLFYALTNKANCIISFSNVNILFPFFERVTYFHQNKLFSSNEVKVLLYKLALLLQKKSTFIVQSDIVKDKLCNNIGVAHNKVITIWPGIDEKFDVVNIPFFIENDRRKFIVPFYDIEAKHKNFDVILKRIDFFENNNIDVYVTSDNVFGLDSDSFHFVGVLSRNQLFTLYSRCDALLFPSLNETIGLPIFEFSLFDKPVFVENTMFINGLLERFKELDNIKIVDFNSSDFVHKCNEVNKSFVFNEWEKLGFNNETSSTKYQ